MCVVNSAANTEIVASSCAIADNFETDNDDDDDDDDDNNNNFVSSFLFAVVVCIEIYQSVGISRLGRRR